MKIRLIMGWVLIAVGALNILLLVLGILSDDTLYELSTPAFMALLCFGLGIPLLYLEMKRKD